MLQVFRAIFPHRLESLLVHWSINSTTSVHLHKTLLLHFLILLSISRSTASGRVTHHPPPLFLLPPPLTSGILFVIRTFLEQNQAPVTFLHSLRSFPQTSRRTLLLVLLFSQ